MALNLAESQLIKGILAAGGSFGSSKAMKSLKSTRVIGDLTTFEKGDEFTMPASEEELKNVVGTQMLNGNANPFVGIVIKRGKQELAAQLFPGALSRRVYEYTETDDGLERASDPTTASGSAVELYKKQPSAWDGLVALLGKTIVVADVDEVNTLRYGTTDQLRPQRVYTLNVK